MENSKVSFITNIYKYIEHNVYSPDFQYMLTLVPNIVNKNEMTCSVTKGSYSLSSPTSNIFNVSFPQNEKMTNSRCYQDTESNHLENSSQISSYYQKPVYSS